MNHIFISIVVPMYNCEKYIEKNIKSILNQSYKNFELLLINDGSTDNTLNVVKKFKDSRIKIIDKKQEGVSKTRNVGIDISKGNYIYFVDADDYIEPNTLEKFVDIINKYNPDLIICGIFSETYNGNSFDKLNFKEKFYKDRNSLNNDLIKLYNNHLTYNIGNKILKKDIISKHKLRFPNIHFGEDNAFNQMYLKYCNTVYNINDCLYHYVREIKGSITTKYIPNLFKIRINENHQFIKFFKERGIGYKSYINFIAKRFIERTIGCLENLHRENDLSIKEKYRETKNIIYNKETIKYLKIYKPKNKKIKFMLSTYKLKTPIVAFILGFVLHGIKSTIPNVFNKSKNKSTKIK